MMPWRAGWILLVGGWSEAYVPGVFPSRGRTVGRRGVMVRATVEAAPKRLGSATVALALEELKRGRPVIVTDDADRENEGDLIIAAECASRENIAFMVRHTSGVICVALPGRRLDELELPQMVTTNQDPKGTAFSVSVDLKGHGVTTGISAADRASTLRALADPTVTAADLNRPGHIFPLRARPGGVLERRGHTEAAVDLATLAGLYPAGVLCELVRDEDGQMSRAADLDALRKKYDLVMTTIEDIHAYRQERITPRTALRRSGLSRMPSIDLPVSSAPTTKKAMFAQVRYGPSSKLPTRHGLFKMICFQQGTLEHVALIMGGSDDDDDDSGVPLVRVHSECATGDIFGSRRCDCGEQLEAALEDIAVAGNGILLYIRGHEGRGIGLQSKIAAYALQDRGLDTVEANVEQGLPVDARSYAAAAAILHQLRATNIRLMTNNLAKCDALRQFGVHIQERVPLKTVPNSDNIDYLLTKQLKMGHLLGINQAEYD